MMKGLDGAIFEFLFPNGEPSRQLVELQEFLKQFSVDVPGEDFGYDFTDDAEVIRFCVSWVHSNMDQVEEWLHEGVGS